MTTEFRSLSTMQNMAVAADHVIPHTMTTGLDDSRETAIAASVATPATTTEDPPQLIDNPSEPGAVLVM